MDNNNKNDLRDKIIPESERTSTDPSERFLEYVRYTEQLISENKDLESTKID